MKMPRRVTPLRSGLAFVEPRISFQPDSACPLPAEFGHQSSPFDGQVVFVSGGHETYSTSMKMHSPWPVLSVVPTIVTDGATTTMFSSRSRALGAYHTLRKQHHSPPDSLVVVPAKFLVGGFTGGHWFITSP